MVDDFGVKYVGKNHAEHLFTSLNNHYPKVTFDWDGNSLVDIWGDTLDFSKVKKLIVHNVELVAQTLKVITLAWAGESAVIKGGGSRIFCEPAAAGIAAVTTSMTLTAGSEATSVVVIAIGNDDTVSL